jgi:peptidoglycan/LPS O-acetylase OafA/YrhL
VFAALLAAGLLLGSYPSGRTVEGTLYALLPVSWSVRSYHLIGAVLVMTALLNLPRLQELLSRKAFAFLGRISFSQYILHFPIIATVGCAVFVSLAHRVPYHAAFLVTFLVTMPVIMIASLGTYTFIDEPGMRLSRIVYDHALSLQGRARLLRDRLVPCSLKSRPLYRALFGLGSDPVADGKAPGPDPQA